MAFSILSYLCKKPPSVRDTKRHTIEAVLAAIGVEGSPLDVVRMNRNLPVRGGDVGHRNEASSSQRIQVSLESGHGPRLAKKQFIERAAIIYAEAELTILASNDGDGRSLGARSLSPSSAGNNVFHALVNDLFLTEIDSIRRDV